MIAGAAALALPIAALLAAFAGAIPWPLGAAIAAACVAAGAMLSATAAVD